MKKIYVATKARGIFKMLFSSNLVDAQFSFENKSLFNTNGRSGIEKILSKVFYSTFADYLGVIQQIKIEGKGADFYWSYNRFLKCDKPYILYVEHPVALYHYRLKRGKSFIGKRIMNKAMSDKNLKAIVYQAKFTEKTFEDLCGKFDGIKTQIYPMLPENQYTNIDIVKKRCSESTIHLLFVSQGSRFVSKCAPELIEAYRRLHLKYGENIDLTILTQLGEINPKYLNDNKLLNINWLDYKLTAEEMSELYAKSSILVTVSSDDSLNAVVLEAIKAGLPIISSTMSGFPEMVKDGINGFLTEPKWWFFDKNCYPNPEVWNKRTETIYNENIVDDRIIEFIQNKIEQLYNDRTLLQEMSLASYEIANSAPFAKEYIAEQWNDLLSKIDW